MMIQPVQRKIAELATQYERDGFAVTIQPSANAIPFDLWAYQPDLLASRGDEHHIVEVRETGTRLSVDRFQEIAEEIGRHPGWRFILVTCDDVNPDGPSAASQLLSWEELGERSKIVPALLELGAYEAALLTLWGSFEGILRLQAMRISLPVERFPTSGLLGHLYSHGELSMDQYDRAMGISEIRNKIAHGFAADNVSAAVSDLARMMRDVSQEWSPQSAAA